MVVKVHGVSSQTEALTGNLDFFTVETIVAIDDTGVVGDATQDRYDEVIELINLKAQPIILTPIAVDIASAAFAAASTAVSPLQDVNVFKFAVEHSAVWTESGATAAGAESLQTLFEGLAFFTGGAAQDVLVTYSGTL